MPIDVSPYISSAEFDTRPTLQTVVVDGYSMVRWADVVDYLEAIKASAEAARLESIQRVQEYVAGVALNRIEGLERRLDALEGRRS